MSDSPKDPIQKYDQQDHALATFWHYLQNLIIDGLGAAVGAVLGFIAILSISYDMFFGIGAFGIILGSIGGIAFARFNIWLIHKIKLEFLKSTAIVFFGVCLVISLLVILGFMS